MDTAPSVRMGIANKDELVDALADPDEGTQLCSTVGQSRVRITIIESSRNGYFQPITECSTWTKQMLITT